MVQELERPLTREITYCNKSRKPSQSMKKMYNLLSGKCCTYLSDIINRDVQENGGEKADPAHRKTSCDTFCYFVGQECLFVVIHSQTSWVSVQVLCSRSFVAACFSLPRSYSPPECRKHLFIDVFEKTSGCPLLNCFPSFSMTLILFFSSSHQGNVTEARVGSRWDQEHFWNQ